MLCADSMHSKHKVRENYPNLTDINIRQLYGFNTSGVQRAIWNLKSTMRDYFEVLREDFEAEHSKLWVTVCRRFTKKV